MSAPNPHVSVFHFSSKISKAKIRKYKLATERGMAPDLAMTDQSKPSLKRSNGKQPVETDDINKESRSPSMGSPPAKKPRLTLHVRPPPSESPSDTIAVSHSKRAPIKYRFQHDIFINSSKEDHQKPITSSSLSPPVSVKSSSPDKEAEPQSAQDDYGDFMSYYITGGDDDDGVVREPAKPARRTKSLPARKASPKPDRAKPPSPDLAPVQPTAEPRRKSEPQKTVAESLPPHVRGQKTLQYPQPAPPRPPVLPQPTLQFIDIPPQTKSTRPDTIAVMIEKLQKLSRALTDFGGVPSVPETPPEESTEQRIHTPGNEADEVDDFLAQFEGPSEGRDLDLPLSQSGEPDGALSYGIQFIQNALRSWAQQRLTLDVMQRLQMQQQQTMQPQRLGRPRKYTDNTHPPDIPFPQGPIQMNMVDTPEGAAIAAFQAVLDSGCIQVNGILPVELTRALRHLYMQIDHLINQGSRTQTPWTCMSYQSQITAHKTRVDKWREAQAKMQEEMARQQQIAQQHTMMQMGLQGNNPPAPLNADQAQHAHAVELERRRSLQHAAQQPYISQHHLNPLQLSAQHAPGPGTHAPSPSLNDMHPNGTLEGGNAQSQNSGTPLGLSNHTFTAMSGLPPGATKAPAGQVHLDKMKLYMPGFLPRSGQSMKFSFAPHSETALRVFGSQAFPAMPGKSSIPNRGPMGMPPPQDSLPEESHLGAGPPPPAEAAPPSTPAGSKSSKSSATDHSRSKQDLIVTNPQSSKVAKTATNGPSRVRGTDGVGTPGVTQLDGPASPIDEDTIHVAMKPLSRMAMTSSTPVPDDE